MTFFTFIAILFIISIIIISIIIIYIFFLYYLFRNTMYDCKAPLSRFYYPDTRRIINAFIIIIKYGQGMEPITRIKYAEMMCASGYNLQDL